MVQSLEARGEACTSAMVPARMLCRFMSLVSINIARPGRVDLGNGPEITAIAKRRVEGPVAVTRDGLDEDQVGDTKRHGGPDQAVYVYTTDDYRRWEGLLDRKLAPGTFGENLTVDGFSSQDLFVGDRLEVASVLLEVTAPRIPCGTFTRWMGESSSFLARFRNEMRPGVYCRVIEEGEISVGAPVTLLDGERTVPVTEMVQSWGKKIDPDILDRLLAAPIASRSRADYERKRA